LELQHEHFDCDVPCSFTERRCCQSSVLARVTQGGLPVPSQEKLWKDFGICSLCQAVADGPRSS